MPRSFIDAPDREILAATMARGESAVQQDKITDTIRLDLVALVLSMKKALITIAAVLVIALICTLLYAFLYPDAPACSFSGKPAVAPSAGCFSVIDQRLLVVQSLRGSISPPGGFSNVDETAQCTAVRETWEETGLTLKPGRKVATLATGFHLYECQRDAQSGEIDPPPRLEVRRAFYLHVDDFDQWQWRYPGQEDLLRNLIKSHGSTAQPATSQPANNG